MFLPKINKSEVDKTIKYMMNPPSFLIIDENENKVWIDGKGYFHREDGPAKIYANGYEEWWIRGKRHREDGPAVIYPNGKKEWFFEGERHREDGPAVETSAGHKEWWIHGKLHREDGPALEFVGSYKEYWLNGVKLTGEEWIKKVKKTW